MSYFSLSVFRCLSKRWTRKVCQKDFKQSRVRLHYTVSVCTTYILCSCICVFFDLCIFASVYLSIRVCVLFRYMYKQLGIMCSCRVRNFAVRAIRQSESTLARIVADWQFHYCNAVSPPPSSPFLTLLIPPLAWHAVSKYMNKCE